MQFNQAFDEIKGNRVTLKIIDKHIGNEAEIPYYYYDIYSNQTNTVMGKISIRIGHNDHSYYNGNIGYEIDPMFRGNSYALEATKLVIPVAKYHQMNYILLTCEESNIASYKSIERLGAKLLEIVLPPKNYIFYYEGIPRHRVYRLDIGNEC